MSTTVGTEGSDLQKARQSMESAQRRDLIANVLRNSAHANLSGATCGLLANAIHAAVVAPLETQITAPQPAPDAGEWREDASNPYLIIDSLTQQVVAEVLPFVRGREEARRLTSRIISDHTLAASVPKLLEALNRAQTLVSLLTVRQVIEAGDAYIEAAGLNSYCMNEGLATGDERIDTMFVDAALAQLQEKR